MAVVCAVLLGAPVPVSAWRVRVSKARTAGPITLDANGNVFAAIGIPVGVPVPRFETAAAVVKLGRADGAERWRRRLRAGGEEHSDFISDLQVTVEGDVVAAGDLDDNGFPAFFVARLAGGDGRVQWQRLIVGRQQPRSGGGASSLTLDGPGDVVVAGVLEHETDETYSFASDFVALKLDGRTGDERWRFVLNGSADEFDFAAAVAVDAVDSVIVVGNVNVVAPTSLGYRQVVSVVKLAGDDGRLLWHRDIDAAWRAAAVTLDAAGDVFIAASTSDATGNAFGVFKLSGATGDPVWTVRLSGADNTWQEAFQVAASPSGDVAAVRFTVDALGAASLTAVLLDGRTGAERWRRLLGGNDGHGIGRALAIGAQGEIVVGGQLRNRGSCYDLAVAGLDVRTGATLDLRTIDGTATASQCDPPECVTGANFLAGRCGPPRAGIDQDDITALEIDPRGRTVVAGTLSDGRRGRQHGLVALLPRAP